jgi:hypothetical protein
VYGSLAAATAGSLFWNFTGQHRCFVVGYTAKTLPLIEGLVVSANQNRYVTTNAATGEHSFLTGADAITTNDALPVVALSTVAKDKRAFGVVSLKTNYDPAPDPTAEQLALQREQGDQRAEINSVGEGAMWACDANGPIDAGDYVTTCAVPGYGAQQAEPYVANFTVGKATMTVDFTAPLIPVLKRALDQFGNNETDADGMPVYVPAVTEPVVVATTNADGTTTTTTTDPGGQPVLAPAYKTRFLLQDGTQITADAYAAAIAAGTPAFRAAFIGITPGPPLLTWASGRHGSGR